MTGRTRRATVLGLITGATGIGMLWASGVEFPVAIPPGLVILLAGALFVALAPWRWVPGVGAFLGLFVIVGFMLSGGYVNLVGADGSSFLGTPNPVVDDSLTAVLGTWLQMTGVVVALITGVRAVRRPGVRTGAAGSTRTRRRTPRAGPGRGRAV